LAFDLSQLWNQSAEDRDRHENAAEHEVSRQARVIVVRGVGVVLGPGIVDDQSVSRLFRFLGRHRRYNTDVPKKPSKPGPEPEILRIHLDPEEGLDRLLRAKPKAPPKPKKKRASARKSK